MDFDPQSRRKVLKYVGTGAVVSTGAVVGLSQMSEKASASVALAFDDADVDLPDDRSIEDLHLTGEVTGDYNSGSEDLNSVAFRMEVEFDRFGSFHDDQSFRPDQREGTVTWKPSHSLVEKTDFDPDSNVNPTNLSADHVSYNATVHVTMDVVGQETGAITAEAQTGDTATITFYEPNARDTDTPTDGNDGDGGTAEETPSASIEITVGFEVEK